MITKHQFRTRGIGLITTKPIQKNSLVGNYLEKNIIVSSESRPIIDGWIETNPFGRYLNHNANPNLYFVVKKNKIEIYSKHDIKEYTELTVNYIDILKLLNIPDNLKSKFHIVDFEYIEEDIKITKQII